MWENRARALILAGQFKQAAAWLGSRKSLTQSDRILSAHLALELGDQTSALAQAQALLHESLDNLSRAYCLSIEGRALGNLGSVTDGSARMQKAISLAAGKDLSFHAELLGHYVRAVLAWVGIEPALAELPAVRRAALESANRRALIDYHIAYGHISALRGWRCRANDELRLACELMRTDPYCDQMWRVRQLQAALATRNTELGSALAFASDALSLAESLGAKLSIAYVLGNLACLGSMTGNYAQARTHLDQSMRLLSFAGHLAVANYSNGIDIGLRSGDNEYAALMAQQGEKLLVDLTKTPAFYQLWFEFGRVRWLIAQRYFRAAAEAASGALSAITRLADTNLLHRMQLLAAEAAFKARRPSTTADWYHAISATASEPNLETLAEAGRVAAIVVHSEDPAAAGSYLTRAARLLTAAGLHGVRADVERTASELGIRIEAATGDLDLLSAMDSVSAALQLGNHPRVLGTELLALIEALRITKGAVLVQEISGRPSPVGFVLCSAEEAEDLQRRPEAMIIALGATEGHTYSIRGVPPDDARSKLIWIALDQIARSAAASSALQAAKEEHLDMWPSRDTQQLGMVLAADRMFELVNVSRRLAPSSITVLVTGETGTGKELLARVLHDASPRKPKPFIPFNCNAIARDMLDAQLFGYRRGAFTGAQEAFQGVIRAAAGGTLFLDEIGEISLDVQPKLLRFLESGEIHPLGEAKPLTVDVRVVAATNANLEQLVAQGKFREDLFYRLNVVRLEVPPLRERREEIPPLVQHYLDKCSREDRHSRRGRDDGVPRTLRVARQRASTCERGATAGRAGGIECRPDARTSLTLHRSEPADAAGNGARSGAIRVCRAHGPTAHSGDGTSRALDDPVRAQADRRRRGRRAVAGAVTEGPLSQTTAAWSHGRGRRQQRHHTSRGRGGSLPLTRLVGPWRDERRRAAGPFLPIDIQ